MIPLTVDRNPPKPPSGWRWELLTDLARLESGHTPSRRHPEWWDGDIPWLALPDIRAVDCGVIQDTAETINEAGIDNSSARILPQETVALSRTASVGFVTFLGRPMATSQDFVCWVCRPELRPNFLMHLLHASRDFIRSLSSGAIHKTVYMPTVKAFRVCIPPTAEQDRLAALLDQDLAAATRMRAATKSLDASLDLLRSAVIESQLSEAEAWPAQAIGQLSLVVSKGTTPTSLGLAYIADGVPFVRAEDVTGGPVDAGTIAVHIDEYTHQVLKRSQLRAGDILVTIAGTLGRAGYVPTATGDLNCNQAVAFVRPLPEILDSRYGCYALQKAATLSRLLDRASGGALQNLNLAHVRELTVPVPPLSTQQRIVADIDNSLASHVRAVGAASHLESASDHLPLALLDRAFSGGL